MNNANYSQRSELLKAVENTLAAAVCRTFIFWAVECAPALLIPGAYDIKFSEMQRALLCHTCYACSFVGAAV